MRYKLQCLFNASTHDKKALCPNHIYFSTVIQNEVILAVRGVFTAAHLDLDLQKNNRVALMILANMMSPCQS